MSNPLQPTPQILIALGSLVVHYEEYLSPNGHPTDKQVIDTLRNQLDVKQWFDEMGKLAFLPVKRGVTSKP